MYYITVSYHFRLVANFSIAEILQIFSKIKRRYFVGKFREMRNKYFQIFGYNKFRDQPTAQESLTQREFFRGPLRTATTTVSGARDGSR
jgi:hypothetical protein